MEEPELRAKLVDLLVARQRYRDANPITVNPFTLEPGFKPPDVYPPPASQAAIQDFERTYTCELPDDLKAWLLITNGPAGFFGLDTAQKGCRISEVWSYFPELRNRNWIPVGRDGFGNYYVAMPNQTEASPVAFFESIGSYVAYIAASDVLHFALFELLEGEQLNQGGTPWPFDRDYVLGMDPDIEQVLSEYPLPWNCD